MTDKQELKEKTPKLITREEYIIDIKTRWKLFASEVEAFILDINKLVVFIRPYIAKAVNFSNNHDLLLSIRHQIFEEALSSPLFDKDNFSKNFFKSLKNIYNSH